MMRKIFNWEKMEDFPPGETPREDNVVRLASHRVVRDTLSGRSFDDELLILLRTLGLDRGEDIDELPLPNLVAIDGGNEGDTATLKKAAVGYFPVLLLAGVAVEEIARRVF